MEAQDPASNGRKTRKMWRKWRSNRMSYNPYLDKKKKDKPSAQMRRENEREAKRSNRQYKRHFKKTKKRMGTKPRKND